MDIKITVVPRAKKCEIIEIGAYHLKVKLISAPEKNKANKELIAILARHFGIKKSAVFIKTGLRSRHKTIQIL